MTWFLYQALCRKSNKAYVGKTDDICGRWYMHCYDAHHGSQLYFHRAIRKYGVDAFEISTLETFDDEQACLSREREIIAEMNLRDPKIGYNIAEGGLGGNTMTPEQLDAQYAIKQCDYDAFRRAFQDGLTQKEIATLLNVSQRAVISCAKRLRISFRRDRNLPNRHVLREKVQKQYISRARMTSEERSQFRAEVARRSNKARGITEDMKIKIIDLYFDKDMTACNIAKYLGVSHGSIRSTISAAYDKMSNEEAEYWHRRHGSVVRSGDRNPNANRLKVL